MTQEIVIIGAGQGGFQLALSLRQSGFAGRVTLIGNEGCAPYQRPPLSKAYLMGKLDAAGLAFRPESFFPENAIDRIDAAATGIDRHAQTVLIEGGRSIRYDVLVLATGARRRELNVGGSSLNGLYGLATRADADSIKAALSPDRRAVVVGAGFIGLEFASVARHLGMEVTVIDAASRVMARAVSPAMSAYFEDFHTNAGTCLLLDDGLSHLEGQDGRVTGVVTASGERLAADLVVAGVGVIPNDELAAEAGLEVQNGVVVDDHLVTSDPKIFSIGDCASFVHAETALRLRLESVQNATDQARALSIRLVTGQAVRYTAVPWFWSDQGEHKLQIAGLSIGCDAFVEKRDDNGISVFCFRQDRLVAVESVNRVADHMAARRLLGTGARGPSISTVNDVGFSLKSFVANTNLVAEGTR
ncbi:NAD(P)/FAD-dependent oxidoreductase [Rhizobium giardinii]|uniref:3-phenylpropionate/trans-cinnamate dioxygenase ferredoxin reductase subunit n=1 Tax=Rhizobium giardinii TaxID=56731 RepID=A0A7W8UH38_9HYPH|nr:FAD-dependent oxidoreductase [Rhizobium giardinii]MBB5539153.1 3-phenylpropionate/trans-cinnamate dioxygenase ferredoxin reductase subunit [Rhizobium giardinii]